MDSKMKKLFNFSLIVKIWVCFTIIHSSTGSIKTSFDKEPSKFGGKVVLEMQNKISSIENSVKSLNDEITKAESINDQLNESLQDQAAMLENLENEFTSIENLLSNHTNLLDQIKHTAQAQPEPNEQAFMSSKEKCGDILHTQSGFATFSSISSQNLRSSCVWIIQANYHSVIKLTATVPEVQTFPSPVNAYVLEILNKQSTLQTKATKLLQGPKTTYTFKGPLIYVVLSFENKNSYQFFTPFTFQFESYGRRVQSNTLFSHKMFNNHTFEVMQKLNSQDFNETNNSTNNYSLELRSIVISNFTSKLRLLMNWSKENCLANTLIAITPITDFLENSSNQSTLNNLCNNSAPSVSTKFLNSLGKSVAIFIAKPFDAELPFNLTWAIATQYPESYRRYGISKSETTCGKVLSGSSGLISHKYDSKYNNGERCVWAILPQNPGDHIELNFSRISLSTLSYEMPSYDKVFVMELNTTTPEVTKLDRFMRYNNKYIAKSSQVYIIFFSDSSVPDYGFTVTWKVIRSNHSDSEVNSLENGISTRFNFYSGMSGEMNVLPLIEGDIYDTLCQVFVFVPTLPSTTSGGGIPNYVFGMNLELNETSVLGEDATCVQQNFTMFTLTDGYPRKIEVNRSQCNNEAKTRMDNVDGLAILILKTTKADNRVNNLTMGFSWVQDVPENDTSVIKMENNRCGGVIIGKRGILRYKTSLTNNRADDLLNKGEHCLWLLQSPNSTTITVKVLKDGTTQANEHIHLIVNTIDVENGTLRNDAVSLRRKMGLGYDNGQVFNDSLLVISFHPNEQSSNGTGFVLQFWGNDDDDNKNNQTGNPTFGNDEFIEFRLRHSDAKSGRFLYDSTIQHSHNPGKQLHVIGYSVTNPVHVATEQPIPTSVNWTMGVFKRNSSEMMNNCVYDSISFYSTKPISYALTPWIRHAYFPEINSTSASCPNQIKVTSKQNILTTNNFAFLVIYKLVGSPVHSEDDRKIDFVHKQLISTARPAKEELEVDDDDDYGWWSPSYRSYPWSRGYTASEREVLRRVLQYRHRYHYHPSNRDYYF